MLVIYPIFFNKNKNISFIIIIVVFIILNDIIVFHYKFMSKLGKLWFKFEILK